MPAPSPWLITDLTPEVIKARDGSIRTIAGQRDGSRPTGPDAPSFTLSKTDTTITATITNAQGATSYESRVGSGAWVSGLTVSGLTAETAYSFQVRGINDDGTGAASDAVSETTNAAQSQVGVLISESFDDQPDWHSGLAQNDKEGDGSPDRVQLAETHTVPEGVYAVRQDPEWSPSKGYPDGHETIEILASNTDKTRNGTGKSAVFWRDSTKGVDYYRWNSDGMLTWYFADGQTELYACFYIKFGPTWTPDGLTGTSKLFRFSHWDGTRDIYGFGSTKQNGPVAFWNYKHDSYGVRNVLAFRGHPIADNYGLGTPEPTNLPRDGVLSMNFDSNIRDLDGDGTEDNTIDSLFDLTTGEPLTGEIFNHDQIYGTSWRKMEFHVKMNSAPGVLDGVFQQWMDDNLIFRMEHGEPWRKRSLSPIPRRRQAPRMVRNR